VYTPLTSNSSAVVAAVPLHCLSRTRNIVRVSANASLMALSLLTMAPLMSMLRNVTLRPIRLYASVPWGMRHSCPVAGTSAVRSKLKLSDVSKYFSSSL